MLRLQTLGGLALVDETAATVATQRRRLALLALIAVAGERGLRRDKLVAYLWPESSAAHARHALEQLLYAMRRQVGDHLFLGTDPIRLNAQAIESDVARFETALARGAFGEAVALYGGPFLDGFYLGDGDGFERWAEAERVRLLGAYAKALELLAAQAAERRDHGAAVTWRRRLAELDPLSSRSALALLQALVAAGDRPEALRYARVYATLVREDLGSTPDPGVVAFVEQLQAAGVAQIRTAQTLAVAALPTHAAPPPANSIAVLPFANLTPDPENAYLSDGMMEEIINALTKVPRLHVVSRTSAMAFQGKSEDVRTIGEKLHARTVLEGSIRRAGNKLRVTAQLINAADGYHLWSEAYHREMRDVFAIQEDIARTIVKALEVELGGETRVPLIRRYTSDVDVYHLYLKGRFQWNRRLPRETLKAIEFFEQAIAKEPRYAPAFAGLADCYAMLGSWEVGLLPPGEAFPKAIAAAIHALQIDDTLAEGHAPLGYSRMHHDWDWTGAEAGLRRALALNPEYAPAHHWQSHFLLTMGRVEESLAASRRCLELEPVDPLLNVHLAWHFHFAGAYDAALEHLDKTRELYPDFWAVAWFMGLAYEQKAQYEEAIVALQRAVAQSRDHTSTLAALGHAYACAGRRAEALEVLGQLDRMAAERYVSAYDRAVIHAGLQETDRAFAFLARACEARDTWLVYLKLDPRIRILSVDRRYDLLVEKVGLP